MLGLGLALHHLWTNDISNTIGHKHRSRHETLFSLSSHIDSAEGDDKADHRPKEAHQRVAYNRCYRSEAPFGSPDNSEACDAWQTAEYEKRNENIPEARAKPPCNSDANGTDKAQWELEQDALEGRITKRGDNERTEACDGSVHGVARLC